MGAGGSYAEAARPGEGAYERGTADPSGPPCVNPLASTHAIAPAITHENPVTRIRALARVAPRGRSTGRPPLVVPAP